MEYLRGERAKQYADVRNLLVGELQAKEGAEMTGAYMGMYPEQYTVLIRRMLEIGMVKMRREVKVVNGIFGVWKEKPVRAKGGRKLEARPPGGGSQDPTGAQAPPREEKPVTGEPPPPWTL